MRSLIALLLLATTAQAEAPRPGEGGAHSSGIRFKVSALRSKDTGQPLQGVCNIFVWKRDVKVGWQGYLLIKEGQGYLLDPRSSMTYREADQLAHRVDSGDHSFVPIPWSGDELKGTHVDARCRYAEVPRPLKQGKPQEYDAVPALVQATLEVEGQVIGTMEQITGDGNYTGQKGFIRIAVPGEPPCPAAAE
jgi:hypothetical protein